MNKLRKVTVEFKSRSNPKITYKTERHRDGNITCFCPGFVYNGNCWHATKAANYKK